MLHIKYENAELEFEKVALCHSRGYFEVGGQ